MGFRVSFSLADAIQQGASVALLSDKTAAVVTAPGSSIKFDMEIDNQAILLTADYNLWGSNHDAIESLLFEYSIPHRVY